MSKERPAAFDLDADNAARYLVVGRDVDIQIPAGVATARNLVHNHAVALQQRAHRVNRIPL
jgi:hypothetical protein